MKFKQARYWKHKNCLDVFFAVHRVQYDDGRKAVLKGYWYTQGVERYWSTLPDKLEITDEYKNWNPYTPKEIA